MPPPAVITRRPVIGLAALSGSGKSHAAATLGRIGFVTIAFAAPIKDMLPAMGLPDEALAGAAKEAPHPLLQGKSPGSQCAASAPSGVAS